MIAYELNYEEKLNSYQKFTFFVNFTKPRQRQKIPDSTSSELMPNYIECSSLIIASKSLVYQQTRP